MTRIIVVLYLDICFTAFIGTEYVSDFHEFFKLILCRVGEV